MASSYFCSTFPCGGARFPVPLPRERSPNPYPRSTLLRFWTGSLLGDALAWWGTNTSPAADLCGRDRPVKVAGSVSDGCPLPDTISGRRAYAPFRTCGRLAGVGKWCT